jgi:hypothetical protein
MNEASVVLHPVPPLVRAVVFELDERLRDDVRLAGRGLTQRFRIAEAAAR